MELVDSILLMLKLKQMETLIVLKMKLLQTNHQMIHKLMIDLIEVVDDKKFKK